MKMCGSYDQTRVRSCLWRVNTFYQKLQIVLWILSLCNYHLAWGIGTATVALSPSLVKKHILFIESSKRGIDNSVPFADIKLGFDRVQNTTDLKNTRTRHLFLVTSDVEATKGDLVQAFSDKVNQRAVKKRWTHEFVVYEISFKELRSYAVEAFDLDISFGPKQYTIKNCKQSDSGTFNLGARVNWNTKEYNINHVEKVILRDSKACKGDPLQIPSGTCRT